MHISIKKIVFILYSNINQYYAKMMKKDTSTSSKGFCNEYNKTNYYPELLRNICASRRIYSQTQQKNM